VNPALIGVFAVAVAASFSSRVEAVAAAAVVACAATWFADRDALRRVLRVGMLLGFVFAAAAAAAAVTWASGLERGLVIGTTVLFRLVVLVAAASVVARSVDAEKVLATMSRLRMERLGLVFGLALNCLPHLGETASTVWDAHRVRSGGRWAALRRLPALAEVLLAHTGRVADQAAAAAALRGHAALARPVALLAPRARTVVVTGSTGSGKTPLVGGAAEQLRARGFRVAGFIQPAIVEDGAKIGFGIRDLTTGETADLARRVDEGSGRFGTSFTFSDGGFELGDRALSRIEQGSFLVIDELGPVELRGGGHWPAVDRAVQSASVAGLVVVVRRALVPALVEALDATDVVIVDLDDDDAEPLTAILDALLTGV
jgi:nucleoside-triphosphatase THEP1